MDNGKIINTIKNSCLLAALCVAVLPAISVAQLYSDPDLLQETIDRKPVDYQSPGIRLGGFLLHTGAELAWENNNNIFYRDDSKISDDIIHIRPWLNFNSDWNRHELNFNAFANIAKYNDFGSEDYQDWTVSLDGRIDVKRNSAFDYKASYIQLHEDRSSPDDVGGIKPTEFTVTGIDFGYTHTFNRVGVELNFGSVDTDYDNNINGDGDILDNQDRNRRRDALMLRLDYKSSPQGSVFISAQTNDLEYDQTIDNNGYHRSSEGNDLRGGLSWDMTGVLSGDLYLQYVSQDYDDPRFRSIEGFGLGAALNWTPTELTGVSFNFSNSPQETTQSNTSGYYSSLYSVRVQHELRRNILANLRFSYTDNRYEYNGTNAGSLNDTQVIRAGLGFTYLFNRHAYISGGYIHEKQDANDPLFEYSTTRLFVTLGFEL